MIEDFKGFSLHNMYCHMEHYWQAAYGLELIRLNHEADVIGELTGKFIIPDYPTEEEFRAARRRNMTDHMTRSHSGKLLRIKDVRAIR